MEHRKYYDFKVNPDDFTKDLQSELTKGISEGVIEEKFWYINGASRYLSLNKNPSQYKTYEQSMVVINVNLEKIIQYSFQHFSDESNFGDENPLPIDFVSLGPGGMDKEFKVLESFLKTYRDKHGIDVRLNFIPVELSIKLLFFSVSAVAKKLVEKNIGNNIEIKPFLTDFSKISSIDLSKNPRKFITALGIIYNASFPKIYQSLRNIMTPETLLLIDVEVVGDRSDNDLMKSYQGDAIKEFSMESLHQFSKMDYGKEGKERYDLKKGNVSPYIVTKDTITNFIKDHNLPAKSIEKIRVSKESSSKTIVMLYEPPPPIMDQRPLLSC